jgi:thermostable 8-oxoguanine DNA glycosylase
VFYILRFVHTIMSRNSKVKRNDLVKVEHIHQMMRRIIFQKLKPNASAQHFLKNITMVTSDIT